MHANYFLETKIVKGAKEDAIVSMQNTMLNVTRHSTSNSEEINNNNKDRTEMSEII